MLKELAKEKKRKEKENKHVVGGEKAMKPAEKTKEKWFGKQIGKKMKLVVEKMKQRLNKEDGENKNDKRALKIVFKTR